MCYQTDFLVWVFRLFILNIMHKMHGSLIGMDEAMNVPYSHTVLEFVGKL